MNAKNKSRTARKQSRQSSRSKRESGVPGGGAGQKEVVRGSGVYPMSGPLPRGRAPIRTEAEWGQGERGAAGYEDSGRSGLDVSLRPRETKTGGGSQSSRGARRSAERLSPAGREIPRDQWVRFFDDFSLDHDGWLMEVEVAGKDDRRKTEARRLPLQGITVDLNPGDNDTTSIILDLQPNVHLTHSVPRTTQVVFDEDRQELDVISADGETTMVRFQSPVRKRL